MQLTLECKKRMTIRTDSDMFVDGVYFCHVLEDRVREVPGEPVEVWKVDGETAIPSGTYEVTLESSPKFGTDTLTVNLVPGFQYIRMHSGNTELDTEGCLLLGFELNEDGTIHYGTTHPAVDQLKALVKEAVARNERIFITVDRTVRS